MGFSCCSDWEDVEPQSFSLSRKRAHCCTSTQEEMRYKNSQVKAPPLSRRRMRPPTTLQNSNHAFEEVQGRFAVEDQKWSARERTIIARTKQYLEESYSVKVEVEELEDLLGPDHVDVDFMRILEEARDEKGCAIFEALSTDGPSKFVMVSRSRWDKHQRKWNAPWRQNSSASACDGWWQEGLEQQRVGWSSVERRVMEAAEDYLESCANMKVDIEVLERLMEPENREISLRYIMKYSTRGGSNIFQLFDTSEKQDHFVANRKRWLESQRKNGAQQESWRNEWQDIECQGVNAEAPPCPERTLKTPGRKKSTGSRWKTGEGGVSLSRRCQENAENT